MPEAISLLVYALAVARITRLAVVDRITEAPRRALMVRLWARTITEEVAAARLPAMLAKQGLPYTARVIAAERMEDGAVRPLGPYLIECPWCVSIYVGAVAAPLVYFLGSSPWLFVPALALAFSYVTGFRAQIGA
jgi:hypothetical protein